MVHVAFGLMWIAVAVSLLVAHQAVENRGQNSSTLAAFAGLLAVYNFLRFGISWWRRRR